jgi:hypothetical protein
MSSEDTFYCHNCKKDVSSDIWVAIDEICIYCHEGFQGWNEVSA